MKRKKTKTPVTPGSGWTESPNWACLTQNPLVLNPQHWQVISHLGVWGRVSLTPGKKGHGVAKL